MGDVVDMEDYRPHYVLSCDRAHVHVAPIAHLLDVAAGRPDVEPLPDCVVRRIIVEWLCVARSGRLAEIIAETTADPA